MRTPSIALTVRPRAAATGGARAAGKLDLSNSLAEETMATSGVLNGASPD